MIKMSHQMIFSFLFTTILCSQSQATMERVLSPTKEEQSIYSLVVSNTIKSRHLASTLVVSRTLLNFPKMLNSRNPPWLVSDFILIKRDFPTDKPPGNLKIFATAVSDFEVKSTQWDSISVWAEAVPVKPMPRNEVPDGILCVRLSPIGFGPGETTAVLYREWSLKHEGGSGEVIFLEKQDGKWKVIGTRLFWGVY